jgi:ClpP class serine protease
MKNLSHVRGSLYGTPLAISESGLDLVCGIVEAHLSDKQSDWLAANEAVVKAPNPSLKMVGDVAQISVIGPIFPRSNIMTRLSGMTSALQISDAIDEAKSKSPAACVFIFDSPGGAVSLGFEVANKIYSLGQSGVTTFASVQGQACSLAYLWASQCDHVALGPDSVVGSVSIILRSENSDRALRNEGTDILTIKTGNLKQANDPGALAFANQYAAILSQANTYHDMFVNAVSRGRPRLDMTQVAGGNIWIGQKAIESGLADEVATLEELMSQLK